jgi:hypothetical protein
MPLDWRGLGRAIITSIQLIVVILSAAKDLFSGPTKPSSTLITFAPTKCRSVQKIQMTNFTKPKFPDESSPRPVPPEILAPGSNAGKNPCGWLRLAPNAMLRYPVVSSSILETQGAPPQRSIRKMPAAAAQPAAANRCAKQVC